MSNTLNKKEIKQLNKLGKQIRISLDLNKTDLNNIGIPSKSNRLQAVKDMIEYLTQYEEDCDHELEFDPIAFRCDFDEYENLKEVQENYKDIKNLEDLRNHTTVIEIPDTKRLIIQAY